MMPKNINISKILLGLSALTLTSSLSAQFVNVRIGDADGFGYGDAAGFNAANGGPANIAFGGNLTNGDFLPDLDGDGIVATGNDDDFDNRLGETISAIGATVDQTNSTGEEFTDISLSTSYDTSKAFNKVYNANTDTFGSGGPFPGDGDPDTLSNQPGFVFDFDVAVADILADTDIFFNMLFGDYDVTPAQIQFNFASSASKTLSVTPQGGGEDGLIQDAFIELDFDDVFNAPVGGFYNGYVEVNFLAPNEPYTAFDFVELSVTPIPEPATNALIAFLGLSAFIWYRRRK